MTRNQLSLTIEDVMEITELRLDNQKTYQHGSSDTYFARYPEVYQFLAKHVIPKLMKKYGKIVVNDIGLGLGFEPSTEPYELANMLERSGADYEIYASDISPKAVKASRTLEKIEFTKKMLDDFAKKTSLSRRYKEWRLYQEFKNTPNVVVTTYGRKKKYVEYLHQFFPEYHEFGNGKLIIKIPESVKEKINFQVADIVTTTPIKKSDITFFANVLQHLPDGHAEIAIANIVNSTKEGGYIFLDAYSYQKEIKLSKYGLNRTTLKSFKTGSVLLKKEKEIDYEEMLMQSSSYKGKAPLPARIIPGMLSSLSFYSLGRSLLDPTFIPTDIYLKTGFTIFMGWLGIELLVTAFTGNQPFPIIRKLSKIT